MPNGKVCWLNTTALIRDFVATHILSKGMVADWVYHDNPGNPHIHLMTTLRPLTEDGFGAKKVAILGGDGQPLRTKAGKIVYDGPATGLGRDKLIDIYGPEFEDVFWEGAPQ